MRASVRRRMFGVVASIMLVCSGAVVTVTPGTALAATGGSAITTCSNAFLDGDVRLGPAQLPTSGPVYPVVAGYRPLAGLSPQQFIATYWDPTASGGKGGWRFPPANGFLLTRDGQPQEMPLSLAAGQRIDRFGSEFGAFLAPVNTPYASRALPPMSLDNFDVAFSCNYHLYKVLKAFKVETGPIAPGFGQRGLGRQYQLVSSLIPGSPSPLSVMWLLANGYLQRLSA
jgi:hypothetical protein